MFSLYEKNIFYIIFLNLDIRDIISLSITNSILNLLCKNERIWEMKYFCNYNNINLHKKYMQYTYLKHSKKVCFFCNESLIKDIFLTFHNCSFILKRCYHCQNIICSCKKYIMCHYNCIKKMNNNFYKCQLCNSNIKGYLINYNI